MSKVTNAKLEKVTILKIEKQEVVSKKTGEVYPSILCVVEADLVKKQGEPYTKQYAITAFGDQAVKFMDKCPSEGDIVDIEVNISSNAYNGKWYSKLEIWSFDIVESANSELPSFDSLPCSSADELPNMNVSEKINLKVDDELPF